MKHGAPHAAERRTNLRNERRDLFMRTPRRTLLALASLALLPLGACKDSNGPDRDMVGEVHFTYTGAVSGDFDAEGKVTSANAASGTFAFAQLADDGQGNEVLVIYSQEGRSNSDKYDGLLIALDNPAKGTITCTETNPDCAFISAFVLGQDDSSTDDAEALFFGTSGQVTITQIGEDRVRGTFRLSMTGFVGNENNEEVEVQSGTFDLPLLDEEDVPFSQAEFSVIER
jgi:hypothetical protein